MRRAPAKMPFERIHNLNPTLNRLFSVPLYVASFAVVVVYAVLPYSLRLLLAALINLFFNRPITYLNYVSRFISRPMGYIMMSVFFVVGGAVYGVPLTVAERLQRSRRRRSSWTRSEPATDRRAARFQS